MKCPTCRGRLKCRSTRDSEKPGRVIRYRRCLACGTCYPTLEIVMLIKTIPSAAAAKENA